MTLPETLDNLVAASPIVVEGKVRSQQGFWDDENKNIYTVNEIEIFTVFKGINILGTLQVVTLGGVVGLDTDNPEMDRVSSALELQVGEMGLFMLQSFPGSLAENFPNITPLYRPTEGVLGFIRYDLVIGVAQGVYDDMTFKISELYDSISLITDIPISLGLWDNEDTVLRGDPSVERSIVAQQEGISNSEFEVHAGVGDLLTISGTDFGNEVGNVLFPDANTGGSRYISALPQQIKEWSNTQILVEVPYRSGTGKVRIDKANGESLIAAENLPIGYDHINVQYNDFNGQNAYVTQLTADNIMGGYDFQFQTDFAKNTGASNAFRNLIQTWACATGVNFTIGDVTTVDEDTNDGINVVRFDNDDELGGRTLAYARSRYRGCYQGETIKWYVNEIEVVVNDDYNWHYGESAFETGQFDFETVMLHEIGHTQQLGHVINPSEVMHYAIGPQQQKRSLSHIDVIGGEFVTAKSVNDDVCGRIPMQEYESCCETMVIVGQPANQFFCNDNTSVTFTFDVNFPDTYAWEVKNGESWTALVDDSMYSGAKTANLTVKRSDNPVGEFRCVVSNNCYEILISETAHLSFRDNDFSIVPIQATCESEGHIELQRENTEGTVRVSIDGGNNFDTVWEANESQLTILATSGSYPVVVTDVDSGCWFDMGTVTINASIALELAAEVFESADCSGENGSIRVTFNNHPAYDSVALSLDNGVTFESFDDTIGTVIFNDLEVGTYAVLGMWDDKTCPIKTDALTIETVSDCEDSAGDGNDVPNVPDAMDTPNVPEAPNTEETPDTTENPNTENPDNSSLDNMSNEDMDADPTDSEYSPNPTVRLYPNPATDRIYIKADQIEIVKFQLFSSRGTLVQEVVPQRPTRDTYVMDISQVQAGVYSLYIITAKTSLLQRVIVK